MNINHFNMFIYTMTIGDHLYLYSRRENYPVSPLKKEYNSKTWDTSKKLMWTDHSISLEVPGLHLLALGYWSYDL